jgi:elongation factor P hydroxylase
MSNFLSRVSDLEQSHNVDDLIHLFNELFGATENTRLIRGDGEPIYLPASSEVSFNQIIFAHGFFSSALHEISHWLIAGESRRQLIDYGYWYETDGRDARQQKEFEKVEVKPQAIEWILSNACKKDFRVSVDNLEGEQTDSSLFKQAVYLQVLEYCRLGLNSRAELFRQQLAKYYQTSIVLNADFFKRCDLD